MGWALFILGLTVFTFGIISIIVPIKRFKIPTRKRGALVAVLGFIVLSVGAGIEGDKIQAEKLEAEAKAAGYENVEDYAAIKRAEEAEIAAARKAEEDRLAAIEKEKQDRIVAAKKAEKTQLDACREDWTKCLNQADVAENYSELRNVRISCMQLAERMAQYGDPEFPWLNFQKYLSDSDYRTKGEMILVEDGAKFQNGFGAMKRVTISCFYDLVSGKIKDLQVN